LVININKYFSFQAEKIHDFIVKIDSFTSPENLIRFQKTRGLLTNMRLNMVHVDRLRFTKTLVHVVLKICQTRFYFIGFSRFLSHHNS